MANKNLFSYESSKANARIVDESAQEFVKNVSDADFKFVQMDASIHDVKFTTKATTFSKDAFRRFVKNKSSVVAFIILTILILMAIFVPIFNNRQINSVDDYKFLPARWRGFENVNSLNGTREYKDILVEKPDEEDESTWFPAGTFVTSAVVEGSQKYYDVEINGTPSPYAKGGSVSVRTDDLLRNGGIISEEYILPYGSTYNYQVAIKLPVLKNTTDYNNAGELFEKTDLPEYRIFVQVAFTYFDDVLNKVTTKLVPVYLTDLNKTYGDIVVGDVSQKVQGAVDDFDYEIIDVEDMTFSSRFGVELWPGETSRQVLFIDEFVIKELNSDSDSDINKLLAAASWSDANGMLLRSSLNKPTDADSSWRQNKWSIYGRGMGLAINGAKATRVTFRYDEYKAYFGLKGNVVVAGGDVNKMIEEGLLEYDPEIGIESFKLTPLGEEKSYLRSVTSQNSWISPVTGKLSYNITGTVDMRIFEGFDEIPYFIFGTNQFGRDQFKVVFAGLRTSLILGLISTIICVSIGVIWGAISGYYGGTVDLVMERITDVLSGIPYIVIMTLTILLLGNNFSIFLLSLVLTGWIGTSARTRAQFYRYKGREFVLASRTLGASDGRLIFKHILPNAMGPIITGSVLMIPSVVFTEANIAYLGLGLQGMPSLGVALSEAQSYLSTSPHLIMSSALVVSILMICFNLFGNGLRDAFNPSLKGVS